MGTQRTCVVFNCYDKSSRRYCFPRTETVSSEWVNRIGDEALKVKSFSQIRHLYICENHFADMCKKPDGSLKKYALPTLKLPKHYDTTLDNCFIFYGSKSEPPQLEKSSVNIATRAVSNCNKSNRNYQNINLVNIATRGLSNCSPPPKIKVVEDLRTYNRKRQLFIEDDEKEVQPCSTRIEFDGIAPLNKECKKTWNTLKDEFRPLLKRQKETRSREKLVSIKKWTYENEMSSLVPYIKENSTATSISDIKEKEVSNTDVQNITVDNTTPLTTISTPPPASQESVLLMPITPEKIIPHETSSSVLMKYLLDKKEADEIETFFSSIAATVKKFPPHHRSIAKAEVSSVISRLELEALQYQNHPMSSTTSIPPFPTNDSKNNYTSQTYTDTQSTENNTSFPQVYTQKEKTPVPNSKLLLALKKK